MLAFKFFLFAVIATLVNLLFQYLCFIIYQGMGDLYVAMISGTFAGLITKYILDKKYIFYHVPKDMKDDTKKFILYTLMGVITTTIFWATEILFDYMYDVESAKYIGAIIGLSVGYIIKYNLDKKYVFIHE